MELARCFVGAIRVELVLSPIALVATLAAYEEPLVLVAVIAPLVWLLDNFSKDRAARYASALELNRAYRGTVMLLSDVLEFEDEYTAQHSRSVVDLVNAVADELGIAPDERQELEFAAMLHDVGKISIPKEILHKPAALTDHGVRGHQAPHDRGSVHARPCRRTARAESARSCARATSAGTGPVIPTAWRARKSRLPLADRVRVRRLQRDDHRPPLPPAQCLARRPSTSWSRTTGTQFDPKIVSALTTVVRTGELAAGHEHRRGPCRPGWRSGSAERRRSRS